MPRLKKNNFPKSNFVNFQPNPSWTGKGRYRHEDCPIRAICAATDMTWEQAYDLLAAAGKKVFDAPTSDDSIAQVMSELGFERKTVKVAKGTKRPTVAQFARENPDKAYVLRVSGHVVGGHHGEYKDCWDSGTKCVYTYYTKPVDGCPF